MISKREKKASKSTFQRLFMPACFIELVVAKPILAIQRLASTPAPAHNTISHLSNIHISSFPQSRSIPIVLNRQIRIPRSAADRIQSPSNIRPNNRYVAHKARNRGKEVAEENEYAVQLDYEADESPAHENKRYARHKGEGAFPLLLAGEEGNRFCGSDDERKADYKEYLFEGALGLSGRRVGCK